MNLFKLLYGTVVLSFAEEARPVEPDEHGAASVERHDEPKGTATATYAPNATRISPSAIMRFWCTTAFVACAFMRNHASLYMFSCNM